jgi:hypothetical protein
MGLEWLHFPTSSLMLGYETCDLVSYIIWTYTYYIIYKPHHLGTLVHDPRREEILVHMSVPNLIT